MGAAVRPAWVIDHNTFKLWEGGCDEDMIPEDIRFSAETKAQITRMLEWAARMAAELEQERAERLQPPRAQCEPLPLAGAGSSQLPPKEFVASRPFWRWQRPWRLARVWVHRRPVSCRRECVSWAFVYVYKITRVAASPVFGN